MADRNIPNLLTILQMLPDLESGGVEEDTLETAAYLAGNGLRSLVMASGGRMARRLGDEGSYFIPWRVGEKSPATLRYAVPLRNLLLREKVDILHLRSRVPAWLGLLAVRLLPPRRRPGVVTTFHGTYSVNPYSGVMTRGDRVIAISRFILEHIKKNYSPPPGRVALVHGGFDARIYAPSRVAPSRVAALSESWGTGGRPGPVILLAARFTGWKGHRLFIPALARIRDKPWTAVLIGDPEENPVYAEEIRHLVEQNGLSGRVRFAGHCSDMPAAYLAADIAVSASTEPEAFGRVAVEAQAMGRPVVATAHGGSLETVVNGSTGWLVDPQSPQDMARALARAVTCPEKSREMGAAGARRVRRLFTMERMCRRTLEIYGSLARGKERA